MALIAANKQEMQWNNFLWIYVYSAMAWICWFESFYFLSEWNDAGQYMIRCYDSFQKNLEFWSLG
jgi:hypothetical protein